jgi:uncharacterized tellurite resistance protein B-like protein
MDVEDRKRICQLVAGILAADDDFSAPEQAFLQRVCARFGLPPDEWAAVTPVDPGIASAELRRLPEGTQGKVLALLIEAALADGVVVARERVFLLVAAAAFGIEAHVMEQRIAARLETLDRQGPMSNPPSPKS